MAIHDGAVRPSSQPQAGKVTPGGGVAAGSGGVLHDYRIKGYAGTNWQSPRSNPVDGGEGGAARPAEETTKHNRNHWLDTKNPKINAGASGLQYGSSAPPLPREGPRPMRNPLNEKTRDESEKELAKYKQLQTQVEDDIVKYREDKKRRLMEREEEKKQDLSMLKNYQPFGRPGGGAPNLDSRKQKFTEPATPVSDPMVEEFGSFHNNFSRPGAGAPLRSDSGKLKTQIAAAPELRFQNGKDGQKMLEGDIRYKADPNSKQAYNKDLEQQLQQKRLLRKQQEIQDMQQAIDNLKVDPYGKPGAGAPNTRKSQDGTVYVQFTRNKTLSADLVEMRKIEKKERELGLNGKNGETTYDPWGKGTGAPVREEDGSVARYKFSDKGGVQTSPRDQPEWLREDSDPKNSLPLDKSRGGAGAPLKAEDGSVTTRFPATMKKSERGDYRHGAIADKGQMSLPSDPDLRGSSEWFGKGGAGAPVKDSEGRLVTQFQGQVKAIHGEDEADVGKKVAARDAYRRELQMGMQDQRANKNKESELKHGGGDIASVMQQSRVGKPNRDPETGLLSNNTLGMSDVTKSQTDRRAQKGAGSQTYHTELEEQARERAVNRKLEHQQDLAASSNHQRQFDALWGRPGNGAPTETAKKAKLDSILHTPREEPDTSVYYSKFGVDRRPQSFVRSVIPSNHANHFELNEKNTQNEKTANKIATPWASDADVGIGVY